MARPAPRALDSLFRLRQHGTDVRTELIAGLTTFLTMSYIVFVNPSVLGNTGMDTGAVFVATCLAAAIGSLVMAFAANYPVGMAPGMGLNAFFAFTVVGAMGYTWQQALGAVFVSGIVFLLLTVTGARAWLIAGIPHSLRSAITAGIGLFLAIIALQKSELIVGDPDTLVALGDLREPETLLAVAGFLLIAVLEAWRVRGAILIGILAVTATALVFGRVQYHGIVDLPPSLAPTFMQLDIRGALGGGDGFSVAAMLHVVIVFVLVEVFDATGTLMGVARRAGLLPPDDASAAQQRRFGRALFADSTAILAGSVLGTSSTTAYIESASGVQVGGRTGLTALVVAALFLLALLFSPLAGMVPPYATAPALLFVAGLMLRELGDVHWDDLTEAIPAALCTLAMPFTYSIANGLAFGFIACAVLKLFTGRAREVHAAVWLVAALFVVRFALE
ncbi:NCS2 family permease [Lysobacter soli]|uniref:NCS2 family permease n=1 Tax=Lysobacter soli TaxID=453783 RepID=UPI00240EA94D|nr:NCS2 family permease [Lysobacter soli]MDG2516917.1 NCS2 family permease [Lysobacter soli]